MGRVAALLVVGLVLAGCTQDGVLSEVDTEDPGSPSDATTPSTVVAKNAQTTTTSTTTAPTTSVTSSTAVQPTTSTAPLGLVHVFPLDPPDVGCYAPGGHSYLATDIFAPEGTHFVAVTSGVIQGVSRVDIWDPEVDDGATKSGLFVSLIGDDGVRYYGSHLSEIAHGIEAGIRVETGQLLGLVGRSGSARDTPPHLHFGISRPTFLEDWEVRRGEVDPVPFLDAWRHGETTATPFV